MISRLARIVVISSLLYLLMLSFWNARSVGHEIVVEEIQKPEFGDGIYYTMKTIPAGFDPVQEVERLLKTGIDVQEAWYKYPASQCCAPGSDVCLMVVVEPGFVIRTSSSHSIPGYEEGRDLGICPVRVKHIIVR